VSVGGGEGKTQANRGDRPQRGTSKNNTAPDKGSQKNRALRRDTRNNNRRDKKNKRGGERGWGCRECPATLHEVGDWKGK